MRRLLFIPMLFVLVASCGRKDKSFAVDRLLTEQEMIAVLVDVQIIEADINFRKSKEENVEGIAKDFYGQLFEHYGITDSIFAQNMRYYTERPVVLERIMDSVVQRLTMDQCGKP